MSADSVPSVLATDAEEAEIGRVLKQLDVSWNLHDAHAFARLFSEDANFTNVRGMQASGRDDIERFMAPLFATMFADSEQRIQGSKTQFLTANLAAVDVWWTMEGARTLDGHLRPTRYGLFNLAMRKDQEGWRILIWHNMELGSPPPEDPGAWSFVIFHNNGPDDPRLPPPA